MTAYVTIADSEIDPDSPITTGLKTKERDNPIAITEGSSGAPKIQILALATRLSPGWLAPFLGDGSDGALTISASANIAAGEYHHTNLTVDASQVWTVNTQGPLIVRATGTVTINGTIDADGQGAAGGAHQVLGSSVYPSGFGAPPAAGSGGGGGGSSVAVNDPGKKGGAGAFGKNAGGAGGAPGAGGGGGIIATNAYEKLIESNSSITFGGGGGGGGGGAGGSGAGGAGAGVIIIVADTIDFDAGATLTADGINGSDGVAANTGGGAGGGGGIIILVARVFTADAGTKTVTGGSGGNGGTDAGNGGTGAAGWTKSITVT